MYPVNNIRQASRTGALRTTAALLVAAVALGFSPRAAAQQRERVVPLGGLFPLSGSWSTQAQTLKAAMELAVEDVNRYLKSNAAGIRFTALIEDTRLEPTVHAIRQPRRRGGLGPDVGRRQARGRARLA